MDLGEFKLYGLCVERLKHQIKIASSSGRMSDMPVVLESYCTGDIEEIIELLELYDLEDKSHAGLMQRLSDLAKDAGLFIKEKIRFDYNEDGELCIYLLPKNVEVVSVKEPRVDGILVEV